MIYGWFMIYFRVHTLMCVCHLIVWLYLIFMYVCMCICPHQINFMPWLCECTCLLIWGGLLWILIAYSFILVVLWTGVLFVHDDKSETTLIKDYIYDVLVFLQQFFWMVSTDPSIGVWGEYGNPLTACFPGVAHYVNGSRWSQSPVGDVPTT